MGLESPAWATQAGSFSAEQTRRAVFSPYARTGANTPGILSGGLLSSSDCQLSAPASGMSVNISTGEAIVGGNEGGVQGGYYARVSSTTNLAVSAANPSNPRIDTVCMTVADAGYTIPAGGTSGAVTLQVVTGTPTSGATLANLNGVATLPGSSLLLGYVLVPASASNIIGADIANKATIVTFQTSALAALQQITVAGNTVKMQWGIFTISGVSGANGYSVTLGTAWGTSHQLFYAWMSGAGNEAAVSQNGAAINGLSAGYWIGSSSVSQNVTVSYLSLGY